MTDRDRASDDDEDRSTDDGIDRSADDGVDRSPDDDRDPSPDEPASELAGPEDADPGASDQEPSRGQETGSDADETSQATAGADAQTPESGVTPPALDVKGFVSKHARTVGKRVLVTILVAGGIALLGTVIAGLVLDAPADPDVEFESFDPDRIVETGLPSDGAIEPDPAGSPSGGEVVVDGSRTDRSVLGPLTEAFDSVDYELTRNSGSIEGSLDGADGLIIADPQTEYTDDELDAIEEFVDDGGALVILGEPNRIDITATGFGAEVSAVESELTGLSARFDVHFDTRYVYDQQQNDGNFRHVLVEPHPGASLPGGSFADVDDVVFYTPTEVRSTGGAEPVLVTGPDARLSDSDTAGERAVALRDGNVLAIGDSRFIADDRYNVGDNNAFLASVVEFVVSDEPDPENGETDDEEPDEAESEEEETDEAESEESETDSEETDGEQTDD